MAWYEKYDLAEDPFLSQEIIFGIEDIIREAAYRVESGSMAFIEGKSGTGKTAVMKRLIRLFGGKGNVIFFDCEQIDKKANIESLLKGRYGLFGRMLGIKPKNMILLLDNANRLTKKNCERIKYYFDNNHIKSVIFTGVSYSKTNFSKSVKDRIGGRVIKIKELSAEQAVDLVRERVPELNIFSDEMLKKLYKHCGGNVKKFLADLSEASQRAESLGEEVSEKHLKEVLGDSYGAN